MQNDTRRLTLSLYVAMFAYAIGYSVIGILLGDLMREYAIPLSGGGVFSVMQYTGTCLSLLLAATLFSRMPRGRLALYALVGIIAAQFLIAAIPSYAAYLVLLLVFGMCTKLLDLSLNEYVAALHTHDRGMYLGMLHGFFGLGALVSPLLGGFMLDAGAHWRMVYFAMALLGCCALAYYLFARKGAPPEPVQIKSERMPFRAIVNRRSLLLALVIVLCVGNEVSTSTWMPTYLQTELGVGLVSSGAILSVYWLSMVISRFACSALTRKVTSLRLLSAGTLLGGAVFVCALLSKNAAAVTAGVALSTLCAGAAVPLAMDVGYGWFETGRSAITLLMTASVSAGSILFAWLMGVLGSAFGLRAAMLTNGALLIAASALALCMRAPKESRTLR